MDALAVGGQMKMRTRRGGVGLGRVRRVAYSYIREYAHFIDMDTVLILERVQVYRYSYGLVRPMGVVQAITLRVQISLSLIYAEVGTYRVAKSREDITLGRELLVHPRGPDLQKVQNSSQEPVK